MSIVRGPVIYGIWNTKKYITKMPKLTVKIESKFTTMPLQVHDKKLFETVFLDAEAGAKLFATVPVDELEFEVVSTNEGVRCLFPFQC